MLTPVNVRLAHDGAIAFAEACQKLVDAHAKLDEVQQAMAADRVPPWSDVPALQRVSDCQTVLLRLRVELKWRLEDLR